MKHCNRCEYIVGITETRCRCCGQKARRVQIGVIALISMMTGICMGFAMIFEFHL